MIDSSTITDTAHNHMLYMPPTCAKMAEPMLYLLNDLHGVQNGRTDPDARVRSSHTRLIQRHNVDTAHNHTLYKPIKWCVKTVEPMIDLLNGRNGV